MAASSPLFFTELVVIAAAIFSFCAVVDATTDSNDGACFKTFLLLDASSLSLFFFCCY